MSSADDMRTRIPDPEVSEYQIAQWLFAASRQRSFQEFAPLLQEALALVRENKGIQCAWNTLARLEVAWGFRKPSLGLYDNALHFIGGAQKYGCTLAAALQDLFEITMIAHADISLQQLEKWYDLDLSRCRIKVIELPYFENSKEHLGVYDAGRVDLKDDNPFHAVSRDSGFYDVFVNNCMLEMVYPLAPVSEFMVHFPEREISRFFHVDSYTHIMHNSLYTAYWIEKRWNLKPHVHIYPPVDMTVSSRPQGKDDIILSVSRFELSGNKQQREMVKAFIKLTQLHPELTRSWKLVLVGGSVAQNPYLQRLQRLAEPHVNIQIEVNIPASDLRNYYQRAKIFWHFSGLKQSDPAKIEHFGMTTAEAMQNGCVPIVFNGGGQKEIVVQGTSGLLFDTQEQLLEQTSGLLRDEKHLEELSSGAYTRGQDFTKEVFDRKVRDHFKEILKTYTFQ
jgi:glycosyltransferase involved in cell wall biosynthesis